MNESKTSSGRVTEAGMKLLDGLAKECCWQSVADALMGRVFVAKPPGHEGGHLLMRGGSFTE